MRIILGVVCAALTLVAQDVKMPANLDQLESKAKNVVDVTLDGPLLKLAGKFLSDKDPDEARAKRIIGNLKGIYVRTYEFEDRDEYSQSDIDRFRAQLKSPGWTRVVGVHSKKDGEHSEIWVKNDGDAFGGLVVLATEPRELTIVNIVGQIRPEDIRDLGGHFGIPGIDFDSRKGND
jgi:Domain of unknown function (DUF4252)